MLFSNFLPAARRTLLLTAVLLVWTSTAAKEATSSRHAPPLQRQRVHWPQGHRWAVDEERLPFVSPPVHRRKTRAINAQIHQGPRPLSIQLPHHSKMVTGRKQHLAVPSTKAAPPTKAAPTPSGTLKPDVEDKNATENIGNVEKEELKVKTATQKLVLWLRNRLRKRLGELAELEDALKKLEHVAVEFEASKERVETERDAKIKKKVSSQKELASFRLQLVEPDVQLRIVDDQAKKLEQKMIDMKKTYDGLGKMQAELESKLREAGFSHWLEARGQEYLPETAIGVLSKSTEILEPVIEGIGRAVSIDHDLARDFDGIVPIIHSPLVTGVVSDIFVLVPLIPVLALAGRISFSVHRMTIVQFIFYISAAFSAQCFGCFIVSISLGEEAIQYFLKTNEPAVIGSLFLTAGLYSCFCFLHLLTALVHSTKRNIAHLLFVNGIGFFFYVHVFRRAVLNQGIKVPIAMHVVLCVLFLFIMTDRNASLGIEFPFQKAMQQALEDLYDWLDETFEAMKISVLGPNEPDPLSEDEDDGEENDQTEQTSDYPRKHRSEGKYYCGTAKDRPLAMGESRGSSFSVATSLYGRTPRQSSGRRT